MGCLAVDWPMIQPRAHTSTQATSSDPAAQPTCGALNSVFQQKVSFASFVSRQESDSEQMPLEKSEVVAMACRISNQRIALDKITSTLYVVTSELEAYSSSLWYPHIESLAYQ